MKPLITPHVLRIAFVIVYMYSVVDVDSYTILYSMRQAVFVVVLPPARTRHWRATVHKRVTSAVNHLADDVLTIIDKDLHQIPLDKDLQSALIPYLRCPALRVPDSVPRQASCPVCADASIL